MDIIRLNNLGLSLTKIADILGIHYTTVTGRLKALNIKPADTRRSFMEDIYGGMTAQQRSWLVDQLGTGQSIKDYVKSLLVKEFVSRTPSP